MPAAGGTIPPTVRSLRWIVFSLLLVSALVILFVLPALERGVAAGRFPQAVLGVPPALLAVYVAVYAAYRLLLVRAGWYSAGKALVQVALMVLVVATVAGVSLERYRGVGMAEPVDLGRALASSDPQTRALAAEVARHRPRGEALAQASRLVELVADPSPEVRRQARASLAVLLGEDAGEGASAQARWRALLAAARGDSPR